MVTDRLLRNTLQNAARRAGLQRKLLIINSLQILSKVVAPVYDRLFSYFAELSRIQNKEEIKRIPPAIEDIGSKKKPINFQPCLLQQKVAGIYDQKENSKYLSMK